MYDRLGFHEWILRLEAELDSIRDRLVFLGWIDDNFYRETIKIRLEGIESMIHDALSIRRESEK